MQEDEEADTKDLFELQLKRAALEKWVNELYFDDTVIGCLVKVAYHGKYMVAKVIDVTERNPGQAR